MWSLRSPISLGTEEQPTVDEIREEKIFMELVNKYNFFSLIPKNRNVNEIETDHILRLVYKIYIEGKYKTERKEMHNDAKSKLQ